MLAGQYKISKEIKFSLQGLHFLNNCLDYNEDTRLGWAELSGHKYFCTDSKDYINVDTLDAVSSIASNQSFVSQPNDGSNRNTRLLSEYLVDSYDKRFSSSSGGECVKLQGSHLILDIYQVRKFSLKC